MSFIKCFSVRVILVCCFAFYISGCSYIYGDEGFIRSQEYDYTKATVEKSLELPTDLNHQSETDYTQLPSIGKQAKNSVYGKNLDTSAPIQILAVLENTRVDSRSKRPAVFILDDNLYVWEAIQQFLKDNSIRSNINEDDKAIIRTDWVAVDENGIWIDLDGAEEPELNRAKFVFTMIKSDIPDEVKLIVERTHSESRDDEDLDWSSKRVSWADSADMMNLFLSYYDKQLQLRQFKYQQKVMAGFKVELSQNANEEAVLKTTAKQSLVWAKTPKVMIELGFKIIDKDIRQNTYFLELNDPEPGFFASLFDDNESALPIDAGTYQVVVSEFEDMTHILIKDEQGISLDASVLVKLYPKLNQLFGDRR